MNSYKFTNIYMKNIEKYILFTKDHTLDLTEIGFGFTGSDDKFNPHEYN